uniref:Uncharacterized protein n=1 Tax=Anguilla anguilla TaxID=7936 RepID=A0A0E9SN42_ANGAN
MSCGFWFCVIPLIHITVFHVLHDMN